MTKINPNSNITKASQAKASKPQKKTAKSEAKEGPKEVFTKAENQEAESKTKVSFFPQDPGTLPAETGELALKDGKLETERFVVAETGNFPVPTPDKDGNFIFDNDDPSIDSTNTLYTAEKTLAMTEKYIGRSIPWSFESELKRDDLLIHPHLGSNTMNAFYTGSSGSINFFTFPDSQGMIQRTAAMSDVVAHEAGHAILDGLRPRWTQAMKPGAGGFHEAFGDIVSMFRALEQKSVVDLMHQQTRGDLSQSNVVSLLAEDFGQALGKPALRDSVNNFKYSNPAFLPYVDRETGFGQEVHAYAKLFSGAVYDTFNAVQGLIASSSPDIAPRMATTIARDSVGKLVMRGIEFSPLGGPTFKDMALSMIKADGIDNDGQFRPVLEAVFKQRNIINDADLADLDKTKEDLPKWTFSKDLTKAKSAESWINKRRERIGIDKDTPLTFSKSFTTEKGETIVQFETHGDTPLDDPSFGRYHGGMVREYGGVQLVFGENGKLIDAHYDEVSQKELTEAKHFLKTALGLNRVSSDSAANAIEMHSKGILDHDPAEDLRIMVTRTDNGTVITRSNEILCSGGVDHHHHGHDHDGDEHGHIHQ